MEVADGSMQCLRFHFCLWKCKDADVNAFEEDSDQPSLLLLYSSSSGVTFGDIIASYLPLPTTFSPHTVTDINTTL